MRRLFLLLLALPCAGLCQTKYSIQAFPATFGNSIADGPGMAYNRASDARAYWWDPSHGTTLIPSMTQQWGFTVYDANVLGQAVGLDNATGHEDAVVWDRAGGTRKFADFGNDVEGHPFHSKAFSTDKSGDIGGYFYSNGSDIRQRPFLYRPGQGWQELAREFPEDSAVAYGVNSKGEVAMGASNTVQQGRGYYFKSDGSRVNMGFMAGHTLTDVYGITEDSTLYGWSTTATGGTHGFTWREGEGFTRIYNPYGQTFATLVWSMNAAGTAVGLMKNLSNQQVAMVYDPVQGTRDMNSVLDSSGAGWFVTSATDINESGQITGRGYLNNQYMSFIATPVVPEPGMFVAFGAGLLAVVRRRRR